MKDRGRNMTEWLMVIITAIYVVATIVICYFNGKAAAAAKKQTDEMIRQYNLSNRPYITIHFDVIRSGLLCFVIENEGTSSAHNVSVKINKKFIDGLENENDKERLEKFADAALYLVSKQKIYLLLGGQPSFSKLAENIAEIDIEYDDFKEHTTIDLNQYGMLLIYDSPVEDISQYIKKIKENDEKFYRNLLKQVDKEYPVQNIVVHAETEDEANKYRIFKMICCEKHVTANLISKKMNLDKGYVLQLLIELEKVDSLIDCLYEPQKEESEIAWYKK